MDIAQLQSWQPAQLAGVGDQLNATRRTLLDLQDEVDDGYPTPTWIGDAAAGAREAHRARRDELNDLVAEIAPVITAVDAAANTLIRAKADVESGQQTIAGHGWTIQNAGGGLTAFPPAGAEHDEATQNAIDGALDLIADALTSADQADADLAAVLQSAQQNQYDGGSGSLVRAGLPDHLSNLGDTALIDYLLEHPDEGAQYVDQLSIAQQQALGIALADNAEAFDLGDWELDDDFVGDAPGESELAALNEQLAAYGSNSVVATAALNQLGHDTFLEIQQNLLMPHGDGFDDPTTPATVGEAQHQFGLLLGAGTSNTTAGSAGDDQSVSDDWVDSLISTAESTDYQINWNDDRVSGLQLLGISAGNPGHGGYFLNQLGNAVERYEANPPEYGAYQGGWHPAGLHSAPIDLTAYRNGDLSWDDLYSGEVDPDTPTGYDPMAGVFEGLSDNPDAAREFLLGDFQGAQPEDGAVESRVDYYLNDRQWDLSEVGSGNASANGVDNFGDALVVASTQGVTAEIPPDYDPDDPGLTPQNAPRNDWVLVAQQAIEYGAGGDTIADLGLESQYATLLGAYMPDVYDTLDGQSVPVSGDTDLWLPGEQAIYNRANFDEGQIEAVLQQIGGDQEAFDSLVGSSTIYANYGYDAILSGAADGADLGGAGSTATWGERVQHAIAAVNGPYADIVGAALEGNEDTQFAAAAEAANSANAPWETGGWIVERALTRIPFVGGDISSLVGMGIDDHTAATTAAYNAQAAADVGALISGTEGSLEANAQIAVYNNIPIEILSDQAPALVGDDGERVPFSEWSVEQRNAWGNFTQYSGVGAGPNVISSDLVEQLSTAITQTEQQDGE